MDGRSFLTEAGFRSHVAKLHTEDKPLFAVFEVGKAKRVEVPFSLPLAVKVDGVNHDKNACDDCNANGSPARLPMHPGCGCKPLVGWARYIKGLEAPDSVTDKEWSAFLAYLERARSGGDLSVWGRLVTVFRRVSEPAPAVHE